MYLQQAQSLGLCICNKHKQVGAVYLQQTQSLGLWIYNAMGHKSWYVYKCKAIWMCICKVHKAWPACLQKERKHTSSMRASNPNNSCKGMLLCNQKCTELGVVCPSKCNGKQQFHANICWDKMWLKLCLVFSYPPGTDFFICSISAGCWFFICPCLSCVYCLYFKCPPCVDFWYFPWSPGNYFSYFPCPPCVDF